MVAFGWDGWVQFSQLDSLGEFLVFNGKSFFAQQAAKQEACQHQQLWVISLLFHKLIDENPSLFTLCLLFGAH
jgi:hypothetical protein